MVGVVRGLPFDDSRTHVLQTRGLQLPVDLAASLLLGWY